MMCSAIAIEAVAAGDGALRIEVTGRVRSGHLKARPPRRTFWQWLLRRPRPYQPPAP